MKMKSLRKKIQRLEKRLQETPKKLAKLKRKLEEAESARALKAARKSAARATASRPAGKSQAQKPGGATTAKRKLNLSPERRAQLSAAMKARWAARRAAEANTGTSTDQNSPLPPSTQPPESRSDGL